MVNPYRPHVIVLPEDDADSDIANGFHIEIGSIRQMQVDPVAGGWTRVLDEFEEAHLPKMRKWHERRMVLLIDFDGRPERFQQATARIPQDLRDRVFVLGPANEPEDLKRAGLGSLEGIGKALANDCRADTYGVWEDQQLRHNIPEAQRLRQQVGPVLFPPN
jgi:hypothetical protein